MQQKTYHGKILPTDLGRALLAEFNRGEMKAQLMGNSHELVCQIATRERPASGGKTALCVTLRRVQDGVTVEMGEQNWIGVAASLGQTVFETWLNPWRLLGRIDDLAQDMENWQLADKVWLVLDQTASGLGASQLLSERLRRTACPYCQTANPVGEAACLGCGAPLGMAQPRTCPQCGFVARPDGNFCARCGTKLA
jgi:hypothetical protein